jgi:hypothetical protein
VVEHQAPQRPDEQQQAHADADADGRARPADPADAGLHVALCGTAARLAPTGRCSWSCRRPLGGHEPRHRPSGQVVLGRAVEERTSMNREEGGAAPPAADLVHAGVAALVMVLALVQGPRSVAVVSFVLLALVPWVAVVAGRCLPTGSFALLGELPVAGLALLTGVGGELFLSIAVASRVASRTDSRWVVASTAGSVAVLPFLTFLVGRGETGAWYFAFGDPRKGSWSIRSPCRDNARSCAAAR